MNHFANRYQQLSNAELLDILNNLNEYQEPAQEAAQSEWSARNLSAEEIATAQAELEEKLRLTDPAVLALKRMKNNLDSKIGLTKEHTVSESVKINQLINRTSILLGAYFLYQLIVVIITWYPFLDTSSADNMLLDLPYFTTVITFSLVPLVVTFFFYRRMKWAWFGMVGLLSLSILGQLSIFIGLNRYDSLTMQSNYFEYFTSVVFFFLKIIIFLRITRKNVRHAFRFKPKTENPDILDL